MCVCVCVCVELYLCFSIHLYAVKRDNLAFTFSRFVHCRPQCSMQFKGVVKIENIEATNAGVTSVCDDTEVPSDWLYREVAHSSRDTVSSTQCLYKTGSLSSRDTVSCCCGDTRNEKRLLTHYLAKPGYNVKAILKTCDLFICGDITCGTLMLIR